MSHSLKALMAGLVLLAGMRADAQGTASPASGNGVVTQKNLSLDLAKTIAEAALAECRSKGFHTSVAVVDRAGRKPAGEQPANSTIRERVTCLAMLMSCRS